MLRITRLLVTFGAFFYIAFGVFQFIVGYMGIEHHLGTIVAMIAVMASLFFRIGWPMTIGTFFGAMDVLGLHWFWALCVTLPGVLFIIPSVAALFLAPILSMMGRESPLKKDKEGERQPADEDVIDATSVKVDEKGNKVYDV